MTYLILFIIILAPGFVVSRYLNLHDREAGPLGMIAISSVGALTLLSPVSILAYVFELPVWVFPIAMYALAILAFVEISRRKWWGELGKTIWVGLSVAVLLVAVDTILSARTGSLLKGDALVHIARTRDIVEHGFTNADPFVEGDYFYPIYHTNILYSTLAAFSWTTGEQPVEVWFYSLAWAKLLIASGLFYGGYSIFRSRLVAGAITLYVLAFWAGVPFVIYPNKLSPLWLYPIMLALVVRLARDESTWRDLAALAATSLILGQIHSLYAVYAAMALIPTLIVIAAIKLMKSRKHWPLVASYPLAVCLGLIFSAVTAQSISGEKGEAGGSEAKALSIAGLVDGESEFVVINDNTVALATGLTPIFSGNYWNLKLAALLAIGVWFFSERRREIAIVGSVMIVTAAWLLIPALCTFLLETFGRPWMVLRFGMMRRIPEMMLFAGVPVFVLELIIQGKLGFLRSASEAVSRFWNKRSAVSWIAEGLIVFVVLLLGIKISKASKIEYRIEPYLELATSPEAERRETLDELLLVRDRLKHTIPEGATLLAANWSRHLTAVFDCRIIAPLPGSLGVPDVAKRRRARRVLLTGRAPLAERKQLLKQYHPEYAVIPIEAAAQFSTESLHPVIGDYTIIPMELPNAAK